MRSRPASLRDVILLALTGSVIAGFVEDLILAIRLWWLGEIVDASFDFLWMTPAGHLLVLVPVAIATWGLSNLVRRPLQASTFCGLIGGLLSFAVLLPYGKLAWWASACMAAGIGVQLARVASRERSTVWLGRAARVSVVLCCLIAAAAASVRVGRARAETRSAAQFSAPGVPAPNVLLIVLDTVRSSSLSVYGYGRATTPYLEQLAQESTVFNRAIATASWTLPSHCSLFTGHAASSTGCSWLTPLRTDIPTVAEVFRGAGYATGAFTANLWYTSSTTGVQRGFSHTEDYTVSVPMLLAHSSLWRIDVKSALPQARTAGQVWNALRSSHLRHGSPAPHEVFRRADKVTGSFLDWQSTLAGRPFFAFINLFDAHGPYEPPESVMRRFGSRAIPENRYDASIAWLDESLSVLMLVLKQRGLYDDTIVVITSDHGEQFGEHGLYDHGNSLYDLVLRVPLIIRFPGKVSAGTRVDDVVSLRDVPATLLDLAGVQGQRIPGTSLAGRLPGRVRAAEAVAELDAGINSDPRHKNASGPMVSRYDARFHYIRNGDGTEELYEYVKDTGEERNLAGKAEFAADVARLRSKPADR